MLLICSFSPLWSDKNARNYFNYPIFTDTYFVSFSMVCFRESSLNFEKNVYFVVYG